MKIWKYNARVGRWDYFGGPYQDEGYANALLARLERDEPEQYKVAKKRPISAAEGELRKQARERKSKRRTNLSSSSRSAARRKAEDVVARYGHLSARQWKQRIPGGKARHKGPRDFDRDALVEGILVELEHTSNALVAMEITMDHLFEDPNYYPKLATIHHEGNPRRANAREVSRERASLGACVLGKWAWDRDRSACGADAPDPSEAARELAERRWARHERRIQARLLRGET